MAWPRKTRQKETVPKRSAIVAKLKEILSPERFEHSLRVEKIALKLGKSWRVSPVVISPAALLHDCSRRWDRKGLWREAKKLGLKIDPVSRFEPKLFHAELSAELAKKEFGIRSVWVLRAIRRHTLGAARMSRLDKIIYLADHIEEGRDFPGVAFIRRLAFQDLDRAILASLTKTLTYLLKAGLPICQKTVETRNSMLLKIRA